MKCSILSNINLKNDYYLVRFDAPEIASGAQPGQFVHVRIDERRDFILRRPFSIHDASDGVVTVLYKVVGKGTEALSRKHPGEVCDLMGPLGNGFHPQPGFKAMLVCGGYGAAATWMLTHSMPGGAVLLGARGEADLLLTQEYEKAGMQVHIATNDGSVGKKGFVTDLIPALLESKEKFFVYGCGPRPMLLSLAKLMQKYQIPGELSMDHLMCCGVGSCFGCVVKLNAPDSPEKFRYARSCSEGPVFPAEQIYIGE